MNPVTFNDAFKGLLAAAPVKAHIQEHQWPNVAQILAGPLFGVEWDKLNESASVQGSDEMSWAQRNEIIFGEDFALRLPFPQMRAEIKGDETFEGHTLKFALKVCIFNALNPRMNGTVGSWIIGKLETPDFAKNPPYLVMFMRKSDAGKVEDVQSEIMMLDSRHNFDPVPTSVSSKQIIGSRVVGAVAMFLYDLHSPANHIAKVTPDAPGKSPEWRTAREHYVVLDRRHEANSKAVLEGAAVVASADKNKERIAHSRRAHYRTFRHERYKAAKGRRVWVRSTWVGPLVWRDLTGSTYQIIR